MHVNMCRPFLFGKKVTSRVPGRLEMVVIVRGVFRLAPGEPVAPIDDPAQACPQDDVFAEKDEERAGALAHASDFADFKPKTDLLLRGSCHPPGGRARVCDVRFGVGTWLKTLRVVGRRVWKNGVLDAISDPEPFESMPITYENAFGGPEFARNPVGKGYETTELPAVEDPSSLLRSRRDAPEPAGFGPLSPGWPQRKKKLGTDYGARWKKTRAPFYAADFDWSYFNAAPADQQRPGYLNGDEALAFEFLHPKASRFDARLPGLRPRAFVRRTDGFSGEVPLNLDTLVADLDGERLLLVWRGLVEVHDDQLDDVRTLLLESEPLAAPVPVEHHLEQLALFDADPVAFHKARLLPEDLKKHLADTKAMAEKARAEEAEAAAAREAAPTDPAGRLASSFTPPADLPEEQAEAVRGLLAKLATRMKQNETPLAVVKEAAPGLLPPTRGSIYETAFQILAKQKERMTARGEPTEKVDAAAKQIAAERAKGVEPAMPSAGAGASPEPGPGANLMERDLSGRDLRGADLSKALLRKAKLVGARLAGANLVGADLSEANLDGADLTGADLTCANLLGARARGALFDDATLSRTIVGQADLSGASLVGAHGAMVAFQDVAMASARLLRVRFEKAYFGKCNLDGSDFTGAGLQTCGFLETSGVGALFDEAALSKVCFIRCQLSEASFYRASGFRCSWQGATLDRADFRYAKLRESQLNKVSLRDATLHASDFRGGRFERATLTRADFSKADLMSVSFCKADLEGARFSGASLYDAKFLGARARAKCDFEGANLANAVWEQP